MEQDIIVIKDSLKIYVEKDGEKENTVILSLKGFLDTYNSSEFQKEVIKLIEEGKNNLLFNCTELNYVSSTGVGAFTTFLRVMKEKKGMIVLVNLQAKVFEVFQLLGFSKFFNIVNSVEEGEKLLFGTHHVSSPNVEKSEEIFPKIFKCPACNKNLKASRAGKFRCVKCKTILVIDKAGEAVLG